MNMHNVVVPKPVLPLYSEQSALAPKLGIKV